MANVGTITGGMYLDPSAYISGLNTAASATRTFQTGVSGLSFAGFNRGMIATTTLMYGLSRIMHNMSKGMEEYSNMLGRIGTVADLTAASVSSLAESMKALSVYQGVSRKDIMSGMYTAAQAGYGTPAEMRAMASSGALLSRASGKEIDVKKSVDLQSGIRQALGIGMDSVSSNRMNNILLRGRDIGRWELDQMAHALGIPLTVWGNQFAGKQTGEETLRQLLSVMSVASLSGVSPSMTATGTRRIIEKTVTLANSGKKGDPLRNALRGIGFNGQEPIMDALNQGGIKYLNTLMKVTNDGQTGELNRMGYGARDLLVLTSALRGKGEKLKQTYEELGYGNVAGTTERYNEKMRNTYDYSRDRLRAQWEITSQEFMQSSIPLIGGLVNMLESFNTVAQSLPGSVKSFTMLLTAMMSARFFLNLIGFRGGGFGGVPTGGTVGRVGMPGAGVTGAVGANPPSLPFPFPQSFKPVPAAEAQAARQTRRAMRAGKRSSFWGSDYIPTPASVRGTPPYLYSYPMTPKDVSQMRPGEIFDHGIGGRGRFVGLFPARRGMLGQTAQYRYQTPHVGSERLYKKDPTSFFADGDLRRRTVAQEHYANETLVRRFNVKDPRTGEHYTPDALRANLNAFLTGRPERVSTPPDRIAAYHANYRNYFLAKHYGDVGKYSNGLPYPNSFPEPNILDPTQRYWGPSPIQKMRWAAYKEGFSLETDGFGAPTGRYGSLPPNYRAYFANRGQGPHTQSPRQMNAATAPYRAMTASSIDPFSGKMTRAVPNLGLTSPVTAAMIRGMPGLIAAGGQFSPQVLGEIGKAVSPVVNSIRSFGSAIGGTLGPLLQFTALLSAAMAIYEGYKYRGIEGKDQGLTTQKTGTAGPGFFNTLGYGFNQLGARFYNQGEHSMDIQADYAKKYGYVPDEKAGWRKYASTYSRRIANMVMAGTPGLNYLGFKNAIGDMRENPIGLEAYRKGKMDDVMGELARDYLPGHIVSALTGGNKKLNLKDEQKIKFGGTGSFESFRKFAGDYLEKQLGEKRPDNWDTWLSNDPNGGAQKLSDAMKAYYETVVASARKLSAINFEKEVTNKVEGYTKNVPGYIGFASGMESIMDLEGMQRSPYQQMPDKEWHSKYQDAIAKYNAVYGFAGPSDQRIKDELSGIEEQLGGDAKKNVEAPFKGALDWNERLRKMSFLLRNGPNLANRDLVSDSMIDSGMNLDIANMSREQVASLRGRVRGLDYTDWMRTTEKPQAPFSQALQYGTKEGYNATLERRDEYLVDVIGSKLAAAVDKVSATISSNEAKLETFKSALKGIIEEATKPIVDAVNGDDGYTPPTPD